MNVDVPTIPVATLQTWLTEHRPMTVLDVRPKRDRTEWSIPASMHVDAYDALWAGDPQALADVALPQYLPVVTVCAAGRTSMLAARRLIDRGYEALSLEGGMRAWSLAWNIAPVPLPASQARIIQIRRTGKGCLSYLVGTAGGAAVIDASLPPAVYLHVARDYGFRITHVLETHVHADHLSRARALAAQTGATLLLPAQGRVSFPHTAVQDGDVLSFGSAKLTALRTPGHTGESTCYRLDDVALFSGDTLSLAGVGRPDLSSEANIAPEQLRAKAHMLYQSLRRLETLDPTLLLLPAHTGAPSPFDGCPHTAPLGDVLARFRELLATPETFVTHVLGRIPATPPNYLRIVAYNEQGVLPEDDVTELEAGANRCAVA